MAAFTSVVGYETPAPAGGDGIKRVVGTAVGTASYETGGSAIDLTDYFNGKIYMIYATFAAASAVIDLKFSAAALYAATGTKLFGTDGDGVQCGNTDNWATTPGALVWVAYGTD